MTEQINLGPMDAALVLKGDGTDFIDEIYLPKMEDSEAFVPNHVLLIVAVAVRLKDENFVKDLLDWFEKEAEKAKKEVDKEADIPQIH